MSNSDYKTTATGQAFAPLAQLDADVTIHDTIFTVYNVVTNSDFDIQVGMSALIDDEIVGIDVITDTAWTVRRGCFDTIPAPHPEDALIWIIDGHIGADLVPYMGTELLGVKVLPRTSTAAMDIAYSPPLGISMNQRIIRPYNVGQFKLNGSWWDVDPQLTELAPDAVLTWVERNRVIQADQLVGYADSGVSAEAGTTYHFHTFTATGTPGGAYDNITNGFVYTRAKAVNDFDLIALSDTGDYPMFGLFYAMRGGYTSWQAYRVDLRIDTTDLRIVAYELREDGGRELREDGSFELREQTS